MDPKAAAKLKRSHTVHGRRAHQTPAAAAAHRQKRAAAISSGPRSRNLPSNWDRYDAEVEAEDPTAAAEWTGEVLPRSKGADFGFLLEQARAQPREARDLWLPSKDSQFDFMQASTSMFEAKGEGILSWCADDNFILEDDLAPDFEVHYIELFDCAFSLHGFAGIGQSASKLKLSQRLFIEEDILPEDLADASEDDEILIEHNLNFEPSKDSLVEHNLNFEPNGATTSPEISTSTHVVNSVSEEDKTYTRNMDADPGAVHSKGLKFEVGAAEEELDILLNSLSGTHLSSSNLDGSFGSDSALQGMNVAWPNKEVTPSLSAKLPELPHVDDTLDDLLSVTSLPIQNEGFATESVTSEPTVKSGHNFGFGYTKKIDVPSIDDSVDSLLEDTSLYLSEQKQTTAAKGPNSAPLDSAPPSFWPL
nr:unnamed protein product [Digitaria exilis]